MQFVHSIICCFRYAAKASSPKCFVESGTRSVGLLNSSRKAIRLRAPTAFHSFDSIRIPTPSSHVLWKSGTRLCMRLQSQSLKALSVTSSVVGEQARLGASVYWTGTHYPSQTRMMCCVLILNTSTRQVETRDRCMNKREVHIHLSLVRLLRAFYVNRMLFH